MCAILHNAGVSTFTRAFYHEASASKIYCQDEWHVA